MQEVGGVPPEFERGGNEVTVTPQPRRASAKGAPGRDQARPPIPESWSAAAETNATAIKSQPGTSDLRRHPRPVDPEPSSAGVGQAGLGDLLADAPAAAG